jgi:hypothetical protein
MVLSLLRETKYQTHPCTEDLIQHTAEIFDAFLDHPKSSKSAFSWAHGIMKKKYANNIRELSHKDNGWHFGALKTSEEQLNNFRIEDMARDMAHLAPELWDLLGLMLSANRNARKMERAAPANSVGMDDEGDQMMRGVEDEEDVLWDEVEDIIMDDGDVVANGGLYEHARTSRTNAERREALITIVGFRISYIYVFNSNTFLFS